MNPKSSDNFSLYTFETTATRSEVGKQIGLRSELNHQIVREHPDSLLPVNPAHSARGGGWRKEEPILSLFKWTYRRL